jgi:hypothetical protein
LAAYLSVIFMSIGQSVTKKPLVEEEDVSGQVEWSPVTINGVKKG